MKFKAPRKKEQPSAGYLDILLQERKDVLADLEVWKKELYKHTANGWTGPEFETARVNCLQQTNTLRWYDKEIERVKREMR